MAMNNVSDTGNGNIFAKACGTAIGTAIGMGVIELIIWVIRKKFGIPSTGADVMRNATNDYKPSFQTSAKPSSYTSNMPFGTAFGQNAFAIYSATSSVVIPQPFLLFGKFMREGELMTLFSEPGVGKTWLAVFIARSNPSKKVLIIELDDVSGTQSARFDNIPGVFLLTLGKWQEELTKLRSLIADECYNKAVWDTFGKDFGTKIKERQERLLKEFGITMHEKLDNILLFELLMESGFIATFDTVIVDCLKSLLGSTNKIMRSTLERLLKPFAGTDKTLLLLHHTNKEGEISGASDLSEVMDAVYHLSRIDKERLMLKVTKHRNPQGAEGCIMKMVDAPDNRVDFEYLEEITNSSQQEGACLQDTIRKIVSEKGELTFAELMEELKDSGFTNEGSVKNDLLKLEKSNFLKKGDGATWKTIVLKNTMTD
jgi:hypothetical protein